MTTEARVMRPRKPVPSAKVALVSTRPVTVLSAQAAAAAEISAVAVEERNSLVRRPREGRRAEKHGDLSPAGDWPVTGEATRRG